MPTYRRAYVPGGTFFFTLVTEQRARFLCDEPARTCLRSAFMETKCRWPFTIEAIVLLPDHLHTIWSLPSDDDDFSTRWAFLKRTFSRHWLASGGTEQTVSASKAHSRRRGVWQRRFWEHTIRDETDFERHCDYVHYNPVRHGLSTCPHAWPYSSFRKWVRQGIYSTDWKCACQGNMPDAPQFDDLKVTAME